MSYDALSQSRHSAGDKSVKVGYEITSHLQSSNSTSLHASFLLCFVANDGRGCTCTALMYLGNKLLHSVSYASFYGGQINSFVLVYLTIY